MQGDYGRFLREILPSFAQIQIGGEAFKSLMLEWSCYSPSFDISTIIPTLDDQMQEFPSIRGNKLSN